MTHNIYNSPIGQLLIEIENETVIGIRPLAEEISRSEPSRLHNMVSKELDEFFAGNRRQFNFPITMHGTEFQMSVWSELQKIPFGHTATYGEIAKRIGKPGASRAVGMACNRNPLLIVVPCHRVVGCNGALTGFAAGIEKKRFLLMMEKKIIPPTWG